MMLIVRRRKKVLDLKEKHNVIVDLPSSTVAIYKTKKIGHSS